MSKWQEIKKKTQHIYHLFPIVAILCSLNPVSVWSAIFPPPSISSSVVPVLLFKETNANWIQYTGRGEGRRGWGVVKMQSKSNRAIGEPTFWRLKRSRWLFPSPSAYNTLRTQGCLNKRSEKRLVFFLKSALRGLFCWPIHPTPLLTNSQGNEKLCAAFSDDEQDKTALNSSKVHKHLGLPSGLLRQHQFPAKINYVCVYPGLRK